MRCSTFRVFIALIVTAGLLPPHLAAQAMNAAHTITAEDVTRHVGVIAADSMLGRDTPSRGLEMTAQYIAAQFKEMGLKPGGDMGTWFQRYPTMVEVTSTTVRFTGTKEATAASHLFHPVRLTGSAIPGQPVKANVVLVAGRHTVQSLQHTTQQATLRDKVVLYVAPDGLDSAGQQQVIDQLVAANMSRGVVILSAEGKAALRRRSVVVRPQLVARPAFDRQLTWAVHVGETVPGLNDVLTSNSLDLAHMRADTTPLVREVPSMQVSLEANFERPANLTSSAPNVIGIFEGSDPKLKNEYVVVSAHMDYRGKSRDQADSISNGADDNASGTAGLLELAKAFSYPGARPRRSVIFLAVSGGAKGFWGSTYVVQRILNTQALLSFSGGVRAQVDGFWNIVANVNLDMIGRDVEDTITINGLADVDLGVPLDWVITAHPELRLTVIDGGTAILPLSDHFAFIRLGVPSLYFHNGTHANGAHNATRQVATSSSTIDADQAARIIRLAFYMGQTIANAEQRPKWSPRGRQRFFDAVATP